MGSYLLLANKTKGKERCSNFDYDFDIYSSERSVWDRGGGGGDFINVLLVKENQVIEYNENK